MTYPDIDDPELLRFLDRSSADFLVTVDLAHGLVSRVLGTLYLRILYHFHNSRATLGT